MNIPLYHWKQIFQTYWTVYESHLCSQLSVLPTEMSFSFSVMQNNVISFLVFKNVFEVLSSVDILGHEFYLT